MTTNVAIESIVLELFQTYFEEAARAFNANPTGDNWLQLEGAMWIRQAAHADGSGKVNPGLLNRVLTLMQHAGEQHKGPD